MDLSYDLNEIRLEKHNNNNILMSVDHCVGILSSLISYSNIRYCF